MRDPDGFEGYGTILELLEKDRFLVEMPNGHRVYGVIQKKTKIDVSGLKTGDKVAIFFSPADMARGIILRKLEC